MSTYLVVKADDAEWAAILAARLEGMDGVASVQHLPDGLKPVPVADVPNPFPEG